MQESAIAQIRAKCSIAWAWAELGLPGKPSKDCRSPFRSDQRPSFSVYKEGGWERWFDHGEGVGGDVVDLWARARGLTILQAIKEIQQRLGGGSAAPARYVMPQGKEEPTPKANPRAGWPPMGLPTQAECRELATLRGLLPGAFDLAGKLGTLKAGELFGFKSWIITDPSGVCAEGRRFDGQFYPEFKYRGRTLPKRKGHCLGGSEKDWLMGLVTNRPEFDVLKNILMVEGQPDYFAALSLAIDSPISFRPVAVLGAGMRSITERAAPHFKGAKVVFIPHNDKDGEKSVKNLCPLISGFGASTLRIQRLPFEVSDLNDFLIQRPDQALTLLTGFMDATI